MAILLYLQKQGKSDITINSCSIFVNELINSIGIPILIVCETKYDKDRLNIKLDNLLNLKIVNIYELVENIDNYYPTEINRNYNYLNKIEPERLGKNKNTRELIDKTSYIIDDILTKNKVDCVQNGSVTLEVINDNQVLWYWYFGEDHHSDPWHVPAGYLGSATILNKQDIK